jgi:hypothetical protein
MVVKNYTVITPFNASFVAIKSGQLAFGASSLLLPLSAAPQAGKKPLYF